MAIKILNLELTDQVKELFETRLNAPVYLIYFFDRSTCDTCKEADRLLEEIAALSSRIHLSKYDLELDVEAAKKFNVSLAPSLVVAGIGHGDLVDYGIRFSGIPAGYEFGSLIQAILMVSQGDSGLEPAIRTQLKDLKKPVHLRVFVTPT